MVLAILTARMRLSSRENRRNLSCYVSVKYIVGVIYSKYIVYNLKTAHPGLCVRNLGLFFGIYLHVRSLEFIESYIHECVLPTYGNTHTTTSETAVQTATFREDSRKIIHKSVNAGDGDEVIFVGSGCTGAIQKLLSVLNFTIPPVSES